MNICMSYPATLRLVDQISRLHQIPIRKWIEDGIIFQFVGDNVNKKKKVRDERSDNQSEMVNMYSILVAKSRVSSDLPKTGVVADLRHIPWKSFLPSHDDILHVKQNLVILVCRLLTRFFRDLTPFSKCVPAHIPHEYSKEMAMKSEDAVIEVLLKDENRHSDMIDIMNFMQDCLGKDFPEDGRVLSIGDLVTCERQIGSQRHLMDGNTQRERLQLLEPQSADWHFQLCILCVSLLCNSGCYGNLACCWEREGTTLHPVLVSMDT